MLGLLELGVLFAQAGEEVAESVLDGTLQVDVTLLAFAIGTVVPILTRVFTREVSSKRLKSIANFVLSLIGGALAYLSQNNGSGTWVGLLTAMGAVYLASGVTYRELWKPTGVADKVGAATKSIGVGKASVYDPDHEDPTYTNPTLNQ